MANKTNIIKMQILEQHNGLILLAGYFLAMMVIVSFFRKKEISKSDYLVAGRNAPWIVTAFSMAVTWVWAPSMFTASEKAYTHGFAGVFWFIVPNVLTLILFAFYAKKMRQIRPEGWTFSSYIQEKYSNRAHNMFLVESFGLQVCSMAVQLLAGAVIFHKITGMNFFFTTLLLATVPLLYTFMSGLKASIATDFVKMGFIALVLLLGLPIMASNAGIDTLFKGIGGITGEFGSLFSKSGLAVMLSFGIPTTIGLLSGTFGDQMFWQRTFAVEKTKVKKTMILAAVIFAIVPISLSLFGFFAAGAGLPIQDKQLVNVASVIAFTPKWFLYLFFLLIISGLISTVDSILCAVSSVAGHDLVVRFAKDKSDANSVRIARMTMIVVAILAIGVANIPGIQITYLFLFYGTLRSSVMLPTIFAIKGYKMSEKGLYYGIITSLTVGLPLFAIGNLKGIIPMILTGSLFTILASGIMALTVNRKHNKNRV